MQRPQTKKVELGRYLKRPNVPRCTAGEYSWSCFFLLFINDLPLVLKNNIGIYADDSTLYASAPTLAEVEEKIRPDIDAVAMWAKENEMEIHPAKTKYNIISTRQKIANSAKQSLDLSVDGMQLTKVESEPVLGVYIDGHLT